MIDGFVKSPAAALRGNFVVAAPKGPHSSVIARLASGAFYEVIRICSFPKLDFFNNALLTAKSL
jgi:hypothetical protein